MQAGRKWEMDAEDWVGADRVDLKRVGGDLPGGFTGTFLGDLAIKLILIRTALLGVVGGGDVVESSASGFTWAAFQPPDRIACLDGLHTRTAPECHKTSKFS
jgi:hypothetical protein